MSETRLLALTLIASVAIGTALHFIAREYAPMSSLEAQQEFVRKEQMKFERPNF